MNLNQAHEAYEKMLQTYKDVKVVRGCTAAVNQPFIEAVTVFAKLNLPNPFEPESDAAVLYDDLLYFFYHITGMTSCPFRERCMITALHILNASGYVNPYPYVEEVEEEDAETEEPDIEIEEPDNEVEEVNVEPEKVNIEEPKQFLGVVPEKKRGWLKRRD